jgi:hypothetical protein
MNIHYPSTHSISLEDLLKGRAKLIAELIKAEFGHDIPHGQCLKIVSQLFGFKNWNTAKALLPKELLLDPVEMARFIRDCDEAVGQRDAGLKNSALVSAQPFPETNAAIATTTIGALRRALEPFSDSASIDASYAFKLADVINHVDELSSSEDEIHQEFSIHVRAVHAVSRDAEIVTLELKLVDESLTQFT